MRSEFYTVDGGRFNGRHVERRVYRSLREFAVDAQSDPYFDADNLETGINSFASNAELTRGDLLKSMMSGGTPADADRIRKFEASIPIMPPTDRPTPDIDVTGSPCMPTIAAGLPLWAVTTRPEPGLGPLDIFVDCVGSGKISAEALSIRALTAASFASYVSNYRPVNLYIGAVLHASKWDVDGKTISEKGYGKGGAVSTWIKIALPTSLAEIGALASITAWWRGYLFKRLGRTNGFTGAYPFNQTGSCGVRTDSTNAALQGFAEGAAVVLPGIMTNNADLMSRDPEAWVAENINLHCTVMDNQ